MWPFFKNLVTKALYDEQAFIGWIRGAVLAGSATIVGFMGDIQSTFGNVWATRAKVAAVLLGLAAGMIRAGDKTPDNVKALANGTPPAQP